MKLNLGYIIQVETESHNFLLFKDMNFRSNREINVLSPFFTLETLSLMDLKLEVRRMTDTESRIK